MKSSKQILLTLSGAFLCVLIGIFIGRNTSSRYWLIPGSEYSSETATHSSEEVQSASVGKIDINKATAEQLSLLPGIGEKMAQKIIDYRNTHRKFTSVDDLLNVDGIGENKLNTIRQYLTAGG